jgi:hypothetical protein
MKYIILTGLVSLFITACSSPQKKETGADVAINSYAIPKQTESARTVAYSLHFTNKQGKDSTLIDLFVHGEQVSGLMDWYPNKKDGRSGIIEGTLKNDTISAIWGFMQEGEKDTISVEFLLKDNQLSQKPLKLNTKTGRQQTDETATYAIQYKVGPKDHR